MNIRVGIGYDIHRLKKGKGVRLGGVLIPCQFQLVGHSDADALIHAICDSILGAAGAGDMGTYFPDTEAKFRARESAWFLKEVVGQLRRRGLKAVQIDTIIMAQTPRLLEYRRRIQENLALLLKIPKERVGVKAKTNEGLDAVGSKKAVAAWAVALVKKAKD
ncbi:MAG: 2-C-methyl-D-erythritol 2,4-cyclodiphosphate synthase [Candidatus Omnitrophica bacterium]|nr:2-C-methyl-D-erythritol 2,4-cyclodiphosphate synthase [Candidatus Omnitrophota bacterium]